MHQILRITRVNDGPLEAITYDENGGKLKVELTDPEVSAVSAIMDKAKELRPLYELVVDKAQANAKESKEIAKNALSDKEKAEKAATKAESDKNIAVEEKDQAVAATLRAEARASDLEAQLKESNDKIAKLLTGGLTDEATTDLIMLYPELTENDYGRSIDAGEAYRIGNVLYIAKRDILGLSADSMPNGANAATYWRGGDIQEAEPTPNPDYKYPAGTEIEYLGAWYYATKDTDDGPEVGYPTWDLLANKPV